VFAFLSTLSLSSRTPSLRDAQAHAPELGHFPQCLEFIVSEQACCVEFKFKFS
jgi:hypothetical protein